MRGVQQPTAGARPPPGAAPVVAAGADWHDLEWARAGDLRAYERLMERHLAAVSDGLWLFSRVPEHHAELVRAVFLTLFPALSRYDGREPLAGWLERLAVRTGLAYWRTARQQRPRHALEAAVLERLLHAPASTVPAEAGDLALYVLETLAPGPRLCLGLRLLAARTPEEISALTGWSRLRVRLLAWQARRTLRRLFRGQTRQVDSPAGWRARRSMVRRLEEQLAMCARRAGEERLPVPAVTAAVLRRIAAGGVPGA